MLLWPAWRLLEGQRTWRVLGVLGAMGVIAPWFSHASIFVLGGVGLSWLACLLWQRWLAREVAATAAMFVVWALGLLVAWVGMFADLEQRSWLKEYWGDSFAPFPPLSLRDVQWYLDTVQQLLEFPGGFTFAGLALLGVLVGIVALAMQRRATCLLLLMPVVVTFAFSVAENIRSPIACCCFWCPECCCCLRGEPCSWCSSYRRGPGSAGC